MNTTKLKYIYPLAAILMMLLMAPAALAAGKKEARIEFKEKVYDFGQISLKKGKVTHEFPFTNTGDKALVITDARADCGCTKPEYSLEPIAPGKTGVVKVTFVPAAKGSFTKKVTVTCNGSPRKTRLIIKGEVTE